MSPALGRSLSSATFPQLHPLPGIARLKFQPGLDYGPSDPVHLCDFENILAHRFQSV